MSARAPAVGVSPDLPAVIPPRLAEEKRWTAWELVRPKKEGAKPGKKPVSPVNDASAWLTLPDALTAAKGRAGVGFQMSNVRGLVGVDVDGCVDPATGEMTATANNILAALPETYAETTPSGKGLRLFAALPEGANPPPEFLCREAGVEVYVGRSARFLTVTGHVLAGRAGKLADLSPAGAEILARFNLKSATPQDTPADPPVDTPPSPAVLPVPDKDTTRAMSKQAGLNAAQRAFLGKGAPPGLRSELAYGIHRSLLEAGFSHEQILAHDMQSYGMKKYALAHRNFRQEKVRDFLWEEINRAARGERTTPAAPASSIFDPPPTVDPGLITNPDAAVDELNERYFIAPTGGKARVFEEHTDPVLGRRTLALFPFADFAKLHSHLWWFDHGRKLKLGAVWLQHPRARRYGRVIFDPSGRQHPPAIFNLWRGFAVEARQGDWSVIKDHIVEVVCAGDAVLAAYVINWMARLVQRPAEPGEVALVLRSGEGTGKGLTVRALRNILGQHAVHITQASHLVGNFNSHLRDALLIFADECFFAGDRQHAAVLKALVTEEWLMLERKGIDAEQVPNFSHMIMSSNARWVVPASLDSRRFGVFDVSEHRKGDRAYFARLAAATEDPATLGAMLWDLLHRDLSGFEVRDIPRTKALDDQRALSLEGAHAWLRDVLAAGTLAVGTDYHSPWREFATTQELHAAFEGWRRGQRYERALALNAFARTLTHIFGPVLRRAPAELSKRVSNPDARGFLLGKVSDARALFCKATGLGDSVFDATPTSEVDPLD